MDYLQIRLDKGKEPSDGSGAESVNLPIAKGYRPSEFWERMEALRKRCEEVICQIGVLHPPLKGTGVLIKPGLVLTNFHVLPTKESAKDGVACFFENIAADPLTGVSYRKVTQIPLAPSIFFWGSPNHVDKANGKDTILPATDEYLDFTVVALRSLEPLAKRLPSAFEIGAVPLPLTKGDPIGLAQCPIDPIDPACLFKGEIQWSSGKVIRVEDCTLLHDADADHGSSGGITCNSEGPVALHHQGRGEGVYAGILIHKIGVALAKKKKKIEKRLQSAGQLFDSSALASTCSSSSSCAVSSSSRLPLPSQVLSEKRIINLPDLPRFFTGREKELGDLAAMYEKSRFVAISGLGGVGKTTLAIKYARSLAEKFKLIYFIRSDSRVQIEVGLCLLAEQLGITDENVKRKIIRLTTQLQLEQQPILLIFDGLDDVGNFNYLRGIIPDGGCFRILLASRLRETLENQGFEILPLETFSEGDAVQYLLGAVGKKDVDEVSAADLATGLGCLPLALKHAAAYISKADGPYSFREYLEAFHEKGAEFLGEKYIRLDAGEKTILTTWSTSIKSIESQQGDLARRLLNLLSVLADAPISFEIISACNLGSKEDLFAASGSLKNYSLLQKLREGFLMHPLLRKVIRHALGDHDHEYFFRVLDVFKGLSSTFNPREHVDRKKFDQYLPHFEAVIEFFVKEVSSAESIYPLFDLVWGYYLHGGRYDRSYLVAEKYFRFCEVSKASELQTAESLDRLGMSLCAQGHYETAKKFQEQALRLRRNSASEFDLGIAASSTNLGITLLYLGEFREALRYHVESFRISEKNLGEQHSQIAMIYSNIGCTLELLNSNSDSGYFKNENALSICNSSSSSSLSSLGYASSPYQTSYADTERYVRNVLSSGLSSGQSMSIVDLAVECHRRSLKIRQTLLGENHPQTAASYDNLGLALVAKKGPEGPASEYWSCSYGQEALSCQIRALDIRQTQLKEHPHTAGSYSNLGYIYFELGKFSEAVSCQEEAFRLRTTLLGEWHPQTLASKRDLAVTYFRLNKKEDARRLGYTEGDQVKRLRSREMRYKYSEFANYKPSVENISLLAPIVSVKEASGSNSRHSDPSNLVRRPLSEVRISPGVGYL